MLLINAEYIKTHPEELNLLKPDVENGQEILLRKKIQELSTAYDLVFIPTTFYEVFMITAFTNYKNFNLLNSYFSEAELQDLSTFPSLYPDSEILKVLQNPKATDQNIHEIYKRYNTFDLLQKNHFIINNALLKFLRAFKHKNLQRLIDKNIDKYFAELIRAKKKEFPQSYLYDQHAVSTLIRMEYFARSHNVALLYRGGKHRGVYMIGAKNIETPIDGSFLATVEGKVTAQPTYEDLKLRYKEKGTPWRTRNWFLPLNSISYGNSLFGGYWHDRVDKSGIGACVCDYFNHPELIGYVLLIDINDYLQQNKPLLFISSLNTVASFYGRGEFFHSRSRAYTLPEYFNVVNGYVHVPGIDLSENFIDKPGIFIPHRMFDDPLQKAAELSHFITENGVILKLSAKGFKLGQKDIEPYRHAQEHLTHMLKATQTIRKQVRIKQKAKESKK